MLVMRLYILDYYIITHETDHYYLLLLYLYYVKFSVLHATVVTFVNTFVTELHAANNNETNLFASVFKVALVFTQ